MSWPPSRGLARRVRRSSSFGFCSPLPSSWSFLGCTAYGPRIESLLERFPEAPPAIRARGLNQCANFSWRRGNNDSAREFAQEALDLARSSGSHDLVVHSLLNLAIASQGSGRQDLAKAYYEEAERVAREHKTTEHWAIAVIDNNLGNLALKHHDYAEARARFERSLAESRRHDLAFHVANNLLDLGTTDLAQHEFVQAGVRFRECLPLCESLGFRELLELGVRGGGGDLGLPRRRRARGAPPRRRQADARGCRYRRHLLPGRARVAGTDDAGCEGAHRRA